MAKRVRPAGYWREYAAKRRKNPAYVKKVAAWNKARYLRIKDDPAYRKQRALYQKRYRKDPRLRARHMARWLVTRALVAGRLKRGKCEVCGAKKVEAHHDDYLKPLDVRWLCRKHHRAVHARATGEAK